MKVVCGRCSAEVELPKEGETPHIRCPSCAAVFVVPSLTEGEELARPDTFPGYRVVALVGHGGMGAVYRAIQLSMDREVAIKVLLRKYATVPRFVARFERESGALAALSHPNIVGVIDRGRKGDTYYFVMEYVHGRTLRYLVRNGQVSVERAVDIAVQICKALEAAHAAGVVHRDIKPGNILVEEEHGLVKVADFGIAHMVEEDSASERERRSRLGTAKYMAPEQRGTGEAIDARADIYGLGVTLHEMLTGELPAGAPPSVANPMVPKELDAIVERATRPNREERFQSAAEMRLALEAAREAVKREETAVTEIVPAAAEGGTCPVCRQAVPHDAAACGACGAPLVEPCFRSDCDGVNRLGAERCTACGGHVRLMEKQRRRELEEFLKLAEAEIAEGQIVDADILVEEVRADPHAAFADLRARASELAGQLALLRPPSRWRPFLLAAAAVAIVGLALLIYWRLVPGLARRPPDVEPKPTTAEKPATRSHAGAHVPPPPPVPRRDAMHGYLLAVTADAWAKLPAEARLLAASEAALCLAAGSRDAAAAERLGKSVAEAGKGSLPAARDLLARAAEALDALCGILGRQLARQRGLAPRLKAIVTRYGDAAKSISDPEQKLALAASTLFELVAAAEAHPDAKADAVARLVLLEASLPAPVAAGPAAAATQVVRAGGLLIRNLRREAESPAYPEFLHDAQQKLARAEHAAMPLERLAGGIEAIVQAIAARPPARGQRGG